MKARFPFAMTLAVGTAWAVTSAPLSAEIELQGTEFPLTVRNPGDQVNARVALGRGGGFLIWQDAAIDGEGLGIAAVRLNETLSPQSGGAFRINEEPAGDQENARLALLPDGGAFIVWQSSQGGFPRLAGRVLSSDGTFATSDFPISSGSGEHQIEADVTSLLDGRVVVVWSSYRQDSDNYDVFGRVFSTTGAPAGPEFRVNVGLGLGRRTPAVSRLANGGFLVAWVGERIVGQRDNRDAQGRIVTGAGAPVFEVAVYSRAFNADIIPATGDNRVAGMDAIASHPALAPLPDGRVVLAWTRRDPTSRSNSLDIASIVVTPAGTASGTEQRLNTQLFGDQYRPALAVTGSGILAVWSSMGQDGSWEGVYGRWLQTDGTPSGDEVRLNTTTGGGQILPFAAGTPEGKALVVWSSNLPQSGLELFGQRLAAVAQLPALPAPYVIPLSSSSVMVSWAAINGLDVTAYRVYGENGGQLAEVADSFWTAENLGPGTTLSARVGYVVASGEVSPLSAVGTGRTWGADKNFDGIPDDWQAVYWSGPRYPGGSEDSDADGVRNLEEWLAGTDPTDATSNLRVTWQITSLGIRLQWPTHPGFVYQLQSSGDGQTWSAIGGPRFAAGNTDAITLPSTGQMALYRVLRVR